ncbi:unnamed protein product [Prunus armeniaca]
MAASSCLSKGRLEKAQRSPARYTWSTSLVQVDGLDKKPVFSRSDTGSPPTELSPILEPTVRAIGGLFA